MASGPHGDQCTFLVTVTVSDLGDGLMRLVGDIQRFGLTLLTVSTEWPAEKSPIIRLTVRGELTHVLRLKRHPTIEALEAEIAPTEAILS